MGLAEYDFDLRPREFDYFTASNLSEALDLISKLEDAKILAGGQSLLAVMKLRLLSPKALIDISGIKDLAYIREEDDAVKIGPLTTHDAIENSEVIRNNFPVLIDATNVIADQQVRNRGTIGGSLAHADPSADLPPVLNALRATVTVTARKGSRILNSSDLSTGYFSTVLRPDEMITEISIPKPAPNSAGAYLKLSRRHGDFAIVGAAALVTMNPEGACVDSSVVLSGVAERPHHASLTEKALKGRLLTAEVIEWAASSASEGLSPPADSQASSEYRLRMSHVMTKRAITAAMQRLGK